MKKRVKKYRRRLVLAEANEVDSEVESLLYMIRNRKLKMELKLLQKKNRILESQLLQSQMEL